MRKMTVVRSKQNTCVDDVKEDVVDNGVDCGNKHLTHLTQVVVCCLKEMKNVLIPVSMDVSMIVLMDVMVMLMM
eukprot:1121738-Ditylum_brightwellii.AAC.1